MPTSGVCGGGFCWTGTGEKRYVYNDRARDVTGAKYASLRPGADGRADIRLIGKGAKLGAPVPPISSLPITVQMIASSGMCWEATFSSARINTERKFRADSD